MLRNRRPRRLLRFQILQPQLPNRTPSSKLEQRRRCVVAIPMLPVRLPQSVQGTLFLSYAFCLVTSRRRIGSCQMIITLHRNYAGSMERGDRHSAESRLIAFSNSHDTWHCNRHTFASRLIMAGVDIRTVAELMGHTSIQMTMRYAHLAPQHNRAAVDRLVPVARLNRRGQEGHRSR